MFEYLWWLLPSFMKKALKGDSTIRGLLRVIATRLMDIKTAIMKSRLTRFFIPTDTATDFYETDYPKYLKKHALDRNLPEADLNELLIDPQMRTFLGTKQGMIYYLGMMLPDIRVDYIYEISADEMKWILFSKRDLEREAQFNRSVLFSYLDRDHLDFGIYRKTRIYSKVDTAWPEFLFWVKVYNQINGNGTYTVYPERIILAIDRLKPAHTRGYLVFNFLDPEIIYPLQGQVFIGNTIDITGTIRQPLAKA